MRIWQKCKILRKSAVSAVNWNERTLLEILEYASYAMFDKYRPVWLQLSEYGQKLFQKVKFVWYMNFLYKYIWGYMQYTRKIYKLVKVGNSND